MALTPLLYVPCHIWTEPLSLSTAVWLYPGEVHKQGRWEQRWEAPLQERKRRADVTFPIFAFFFIH